MPFAIETWCGWVVSGAHQNNACKDVCTYVLHANVENCEELMSMSPQILEDPLKTSLEKFWAIEGVTDESNNAINVEEFSVVKQFKSNITYKNDRYEVPLLVKPYARDLPDAYYLSSKRFQILTDKLNKDVKLKNEY